MFFYCPRFFFSIIFFGKKNVENFFFGVLDLSYYFVFTFDSFLLFNVKSKSYDFLLHILRF